MVERNRFSARQSHDFARINASSSCNGAGGYRDKLGRSRLRSNQETNNGLITRRNSHTLSELVHVRLTVRPNGADRSRRCNISRSSATKMTYGTKISCRSLLRQLVFLTRESGAKCQCSGTQHRAGTSARSSGASISSAGVWAR
jgi:hypothetical protein